MNPEKDEIKDLPGAPGAFNFKQYSGYGLVNSTNGRNLFYWFVESQSKPSQDPLVLWLSGSPGCSSLGVGFMTENGPFRPNADNTLRVNEHSWNKVANMLYLESPSGVGFSYSDTPSDYIDAKDGKSALDVVAFLVEFLKAYPAYKGRPFYISGESYGGHYVPTTAQAIVQHNAMVTEDMKINLQGIFVGNGWTLPSADNAGTVQTWLGYNLIRLETGANVMKYCNLSSMHDVFDIADGNNIRCKWAVSNATTEMGKINHFNIYESLCMPSKTDSRFAFLSMLAQSSAPLNVHAASILAQIQDADPCEPKYATKYLSTPAVQKAIHAHHLTWSECNEKIVSSYSRTDFMASMLPVYKYLLREKIRVHIYSGDTDAMVPPHGTRKWISLLERAGDIKVTRSWYPWFDSTSQLGGRQVEYGPLFDFTTVREAGHMVSTSQPGRALDVFRRFLKGA